MAVFCGKNPETHEYYVYLDTYGGGSGGRAYKDGKDGVQVHITNTSNLPIEALESEYPLFIETYALIPDSGGAGNSRGGMGLRRDVRILNRYLHLLRPGRTVRPAALGTFRREGRGNREARAPFGNQG